MQRLNSTVGWLISATLALVPGAVPTGTVDPGPEMDWSAAQRDDVAAVAYFATSIYEPTGRASLLVIHDDGSTDVVPVGALDIAMLAAGPDRAFTYSSSTTTTTVNADSADAWLRGGEQWTGEWTGITDAGETLAVFNTGDVFITDGSRRAHVKVPDGPGATGMSRDAVWLLRQGSLGVHGRVSLYRIALAGDPKPQRTTWMYHGGRGGWLHGGQELGTGTSIFSHRNRLWYLEQLVAQDRTMTLRLAEVDPRKQGKGYYTSHGIGPIPRALYDDRDGVNRLAAQAGEGHLYRGGLYIVNGQGELLRVSLATARMRVIGRVRRHARNAVDAAVSWNEGTLNVLVGDVNPKKLRLETYDLRSGERSSSMEIAVPKEIWSDAGQFLGAMAVPRD